MEPWCAYLYRYTGSGLFSATALAEESAEAMKNVVPIKSVRV